jgi:two-component system response regulator
METTKLNSVDILLVEDNDNDADLTKRALHKYKMGDNLIRVKDGQEALDFIFAAGQFLETRDIAFPPKLILLDIRMPKVNGLEVLQQLKCSPLTKAIPVVILTSSKEESDVQKCYNLGANSYIVKPIDFKIFSDSIRDVGYYWLNVNQPPSLENLYL